MVCRDGVERLMDYLDGAVPAAERRVLESHVASCARCTAFVASYRETPRIFRTATDAALPEEMAAALRRFLVERR
jgi:anti-sigma factor RsiW